MGVSKGNGHEIAFMDLVGEMWKGRLWIAAATVIALLAAGIVYISVPRIYQSTVEIRPITQSDFANYTALIDFESFPYSREALFETFSSYLLQPSFLLGVANKDGVLPRPGKSDDEYNSEVMSFVHDVVALSTPDEERLLRMRVRGKDPTTMERFAASALKEANSIFARRIAFEIKKKVASRDGIRAFDIRAARVKISALRKGEEARRQDSITRLGEQAKIARLLGIDKPVGFQLSPSQPGENLSIQVQLAEQPAFFRGYLAIEEEIESSRARQSGDPFIGELRKLEEEIFLLENDKRTERTVQLLEESGLEDAVESPLVQYDLAAAETTKIFPRASTFALVGLLLGLLAGTGIHFYRAYQKTT